MSRMDSVIETREVRIVYEDESFASFDGCSDWTQDEIIEEKFDEWHNILDQVEEVEIDE